MTRRPYSHDHVVLSLFLAVSASCAPRLGPPSTAVPADSAEAILVVENGHFDAVWVAIERAGGRIRLGRVDGVSVRRFRLPASLLAAASRVRLTAGVRGSHPPPVAASLELAPGQRVRWVLSLGLNHSALFR